MALDNTITVSGNATRDPELRYTDTGKPVANLAVAVNRKWTKPDGETEEHVTFIDITAWGDLGLNVAETITKGSRIIVNGRLDQHTWQTPEGDTRNRHQITADDIAPSLKWAKVNITKTKPIGTTKPAHNQPKPTLEEEPF